MDAVGQVSDPPRKSEICATARSG